MHDAKDTIKSKPWGQKSCRKENKNVDVLLLVSFDFAVAECGILTMPLLSPNGQKEPPFPALPFLSYRPNGQGTCYSPGTQWQTVIALSVSVSTHPKGADLSHVVQPSGGIHRSNLDGNEERLPRLLAVISSTNANSIRHNWYDDGSITSSTDKRVASLPYWPYLTGTFKIEACKEDGTDKPLIHLWWLTAKRSLGIFRLVALKNKNKKNNNEHPLRWHLDGISSRKAFYVVAPQIYSVIPTATLGDRVLVFSFTFLVPTVWIENN